MLSPQEFATAWGEDRYRFPPEILQGVDIPDDAKMFLRETGLPVRAEVQMDIHAVVLPIAFGSTHAPVLLPLLSRYESTRLRVSMYVMDDLFLLSDEYRKFNVYYAIEEKTGHIYRVGPGGEVETLCFVNTSVAQYTNFLLCYQEFVTHFRRDRSQYHPLLTSLKQKWRQIDPAALTDPDNYWVMCLYEQF